MAGRQPLPEEERRDRAVYFLKRHEREQVDALIVRMRQPSQPSDEDWGKTAMITESQGFIGERATASILSAVRSVMPGAFKPKKPEVYVPREDEFFEED